MKIFLRLSALLLLLAILLGAFSSCAVLSSVASGLAFDVFDGVLFKDAFDLEEYNKYKVDLDISVTPTEGEGFYYAQLDENGKMMYNAMVEAISNGKNYCVFENVDVDALEGAAENTVHALYKDHPEFFWLELGWYFVKSYLKKGIGRATLIIGCCDFWTDDETARRMIGELEARVDDIAAEAEKCADEYEKIKYVHDLIAESVEYDEVGMVESNAESNSPYSALVLGKAVCGGYSRAFQLLMKELDIECICILGDAIGGPHMWNCVYIDGEPYLMDLTWADVEENILYEWFGLTTKAMGKTHVPSDRFDIPTCDSTEYNYYVYNGYLLEKYDRATFNKVANKQKDSDIVFVKFTSAYELNRAKDDLITKNNWTELDIFKREDQIIYSVDENMLLFIIYD